MDMRISNTLHVVAIALALVYTSSSAVLPKRNTTITVPDGITYHQDSKSICTPTSWTDILTFFFGNYVVHAASTVTLPGESSFGNIQNMLAALRWPAQGVRRGMLVIFRRAVFWKDPLQQAHRAAALCMVVRSRRWKPEPGEPVRSMALWPQIARREGASEPTEKRPWTSRLYSKMVDLDYILSKPDNYTPRQFDVMHSKT
ncbi:pogo transposable element [Penicillium malachiteum]|uniref:Pogo transposable element n=1 Tax=Penicillium malachiteum TaxID=1324776 RepID=A0AAD6HRA3_9EURO|nr:pogo transposable element [Penicillium malachiteum]